MKSRPTSWNYHFLWKLNICALLSVQSLSLMWLTHSALRRSSKRNIAKTDVFSPNKVPVNHNDSNISLGPRTERSENSPCHIKRPSNFWDLSFNYTFSLALRWSFFCNSHESLTQCFGNLIWSQHFCHRWRNTKNFYFKLKIWILEIEWMVRDKSSSKKTDLEVTCWTVHVNLVITNAHLVKLMSLSPRSWWCRW